MTLYDVNDLLAHIITNAIQSLELRSAYDRNWVSFYRIHSMTVYSSFPFIMGSNRNLFALNEVIYNKKKPIGKLLKSLAYKEPNLKEILKT